MIDVFTKDDFEDVLRRIGGNWKPEQRYNEWVYSAPHGGGRVHINSSIRIGSTSKGTGKDSIRVVVEHSGTFKKTSQRWITRQEGWAERLEKAVIEARVYINELDYSPKCPNCDGAMVIRKGVHGKFYGCLKFPRCRGTRNFEVPEKEFLNAIS